MATNRGGFSYSSKSAAPNLGHKRGTGNPSTMHSSRGMSTVKKPKSSAAGLQGLSIGQQVPMKMFDQKYQKPNLHGMGQVQDANVVKKAAKKSLRGAQQKFFGL